MTYVGLPPPWFLPDSQQTRPLPDERPRQSVANLIGKFENQTKRTCDPGQTPPRSTSVVSNNTGDSAKEELREKREWPPKLPTALSVPVAPNSSSEPPLLDAPRVQPAAPEKQPENNTTPSKCKTDPPVTPPTKLPTKPKSLVPSASSPPSQPLKPQHTGQSTTTTTAHKRPTTKANPSAPSRPKTPARPKTPSRTLPTRSSSLYAPTAASLARTRHAPSPDTSPRKPVSATVSDRLNRPTASSLSRTRDHVPPPPVKSPAAALPRATIPKTINRPQGLLPSTRGSKAPVPPSKTLAKKTPSGASPQPVRSAAPAANVVAAVSDASGVDQAIFSSRAEPKTEIPPVPTLEPTKEPEAGSQVQRQTEPETQISDDEKDETTRTHFETQIEHKQAEEEAKVNPNGLAPSSHGVQAESTLDQITVLASKHDTDNVGTELEQIVNLLETVPQPVASNPSDTINIVAPLDLQEIPDEGVLI